MVKLKINKKYFINLKDFLYSKFHILNSNRGFTLIEILIVISIIVLISGMVITSVLSYKIEADLSVSVQNVIDKLRTARNQTVASKSDDRWGVHLESSSAVLFKSANYNALDPNNEIYNLPASIEIANGSLSLPADIVFNRITGETFNYGTFELRDKNNNSRFKTIKIELSGQVSVSEGLIPPLGTRVSDWRHTHFVYERPISADNEILTLVIDDSYIINLTIKDYLDANSHFNWSGTVSINGENQNWEIHSHYLNDLINKTVFSIYRGGENNKSMVLTISGEAGVNLISYNTAGLASKGNSIYALAPIAQ